MNCIAFFWLLIGSFKIGSVPGMTNKEVLAQLIYKPE